MTTTAMKPPKKLRSETAYARFLIECDHDADGDLAIVREIPRHAEIAGVYGHSPMIPVLRWNGIEVVVREVRQCVYEVYEASAT